MAAEPYQDPAVRPADASKSVAMARYVTIFLGIGLPAVPETDVLTKDNWEAKTRILVEFFEQLPSPVEPEDGPKATAEKVFAIAAQIKAGKWTTYGDLSTAASGRSSAAMAIGRMARSMPDFPNPHRILNLRGQIPSGWCSEDGQGPEECRRRLELEGVGFDETGTAFGTARLPIERLIARVQ